MLLGAIGAVAAPATAQVVRDANCDGVVDESDRAALVSDLFGSDGAPCAGADVNRDGRISAADLIAFAVGPRISYIGIASPDGQPSSSLGTLEDGAPVYFRNSGFGFLVVVEAVPSASGTAIGTTTFDSVPGDPRQRPDFQILVDHRLGNGSRDVCDEFGVPGVDPPDFAVTQAVSDTINDLSCRFDVATSRNSTCTHDEFGSPSFIVPSSRAQFCLPVNSLMAFPDGETRLSVQIRDRSGQIGPLRQMVLQVGAGPPPPTFTPRPPTETPTATDTASPSPTASPTRSASATRIASATATRTRSAPPASTATVTGTPTRTRTGPTATATATPSRTRTGATPTRTATATISGPTPTRTRTATATISGPTPTRTRTLSPTPSVTAAVNGPVITFFGLTRADDVLIDPSGASGDIPIYQPLFGYGFSLVVEAMPGPSHAPVAKSTFVSGAAPDLQVQVTRPLGNGSTTVCDDTPPIIGGVPAINPPNFSDDPPVADPLNDLGCRFIDGAGAKIGRACSESTACVLGTDGQFACVAPNTSLQFCGFIGQILTFPSGDTTVTVRVRDVQGRLGPAKQLIIRVP